MEITAKKMEMRYGRPFTTESLYPFFGVDPDFLQQALKEIGDVRTYAAQVLGLTERDIGNLQARYTA